MNETKPEVLNQDIGDADIQYLHFPGDGPTIVALHATGFNPWLWQPIAKRLTGSCRIIAPYFCDHRQTEPTEGGLNWMLLARDLTEFCRRLELDNPLFVGHSMGATVIAIANAEFGNTAKKMLLIEPIVLQEEYYTPGFTVDRHPLAARTLKRRNQWQEHDEVVDYFKSKELFQSWDDEMLDLYVKYGVQQSADGGFQLVCSPRREASLFMGGMQYNPWPILSKVLCPVLVVKGETSGNARLVDLEEIARRFPNSTFTVIKDAGHLVTMEKPREILGLIKEFLLEEPS